MTRALAFLLLATACIAQQAAPSTAVKDEIAFAETGGPVELARSAAIYSVKDGKAVKVREGTNGCACFVMRWAPGTEMPTCYDPAATRVVLPRDLKEAALIAQGKKDEDIDAEIGRAFVSGELQTPPQGAVIYMISPQGKVVRNGKVVNNSPHVMISVPYMKNPQIGIFDVESAIKQGVPYINHEGTVDAIIIVDVPPSHHEGH